MSLLDEAYHLVHDHPGGAPALAARLKKNHGTLCHELTATGSAKLGLLDAKKLTDFTGDLRILQAWAMEAGQMLMPLPKDGQPTDECLARVASMAKEFGDLVKEVTHDLGDNQISDNELDRIEREASQLVAAVHHLLASLRQRNQDGKPNAERQVP
ncbi:MAG TPA: hypothetical protein DDX06_16015 [Curvibacter sp.]|nr:hypothetical protein [Curvibacter sp.]|tara:strand:- start:274 stop:741 length:468 start_codon:yes stop_codon:yes gene_type:complete